MESKRRKELAPENHGYRVVFGGDEFDDASWLELADLLAADEALDEAVAALEKAESVLAASQWSGEQSGDPTVFATCHFCGAVEYNDHKDDCDWKLAMAMIAKALKEAKPSS